MDEKIRESQVKKQMNKLKDTLASLEKGMVGIRERLAPVLWEDTLEHGEDKDKIEVLVPFARELRDIVSRIHTLDIEVIDLLKKLEL